MKYAGEAALTESTAGASTRRKRVEQKERALLKAARSVFVENGYDGAKVADIARLAGISEGSVYSYYENKGELMHAVLAEFWEGLTTGAVRSVDLAASPFEQMTALGRYHLRRVMENFDFVNLTFALRRAQGELSASRDQMRRYVSVFNDIVRRGIDRGVIKPDVKIWLLRDAFYGTLEYAARTLVGRRVRKRDDAERVIQNLVGQISAFHGMPKRPVQQASAYDPVIDRLQSIAVRLEAVLPSSRVLRSAASRSSK